MKFHSLCRKSLSALHLSLSRGEIISAHSLFKIPADCYPPQKATFWLLVPQDLSFYLSHYSFLLKLSAFASLAQVIPQQLNNTTKHNSENIYYSFPHVAGWPSFRHPKEGKKTPTWTKSSQFISMQQGCWEVCVMDGRRWRLWQLINALIISGEDLPLLPELTEWAVCGLTSNPVFRARPLLSAVRGSHSFCFQKKAALFFGAV